MPDLTLSRASLAPTGFVSFTDNGYDTKPVGARLAREGRDAVLDQSIGP
ncbi:hypothetical protein EMIT0P44_60004 [Pseudomonas sp. IT-P44]